MKVPDFEKMSNEDLIAYMVNCVGGPLMSTVATRMNMLLAETARRGPLQLSVGTPEEGLSVFGSEAAMAKVRDLGVELGRVGQMLNATKNEVALKSQKIEALEEAYRNDVVKPANDQKGE